MHIACERGQLQSVTRLLQGNGSKKKTNINLQNAFGETPLHLAIKVSPSPCWVLLLRMKKT